MSLADELRDRRASVEGGAAPVAPRRARRWDLLVAWALLAGPALALLAWAGARQRVGDLVDRLAHDAVAVLDAPHPRPVHRGVAAPGSVGDALVTHLAPFVAFAAAPEDAAVERDRKTLRAVAAGEAPASAIPPRYREALRALGPDLDAVLAGTRAERAELEASDGTSPDELKWVSAVQLAATLAAARAQLRLEAGDANGAVADCLDALALGRDAAIARGLVGHMVGVAIVSRVAPSCAAAASALPPAAARAALGSVRRVRDGFPTFAATMREETIAMELIGVGAELPAEARARLGPRSRAALAEGAALSDPWQRLLLRDAWRDSRAAYDDLVRAFALPPTARAPAVAAIEARLGRRLNFTVSILPVKSFAKYAARADAAQRRLDALAVGVAAAVYRSDTRGWPRTAADLFAARLVDAAEASAVVRLDAAARALSVVAPLPRAEGDDAADAQLVLRVPDPLADR